MPRIRDDEEEKIGPAYTPMPRAAQRAAVDKTFDDLVSDAKALKGSVFDRPFDKALRFGAADPMGGMAPQAMGMPAVVANPGHRAFKEILARDPRWAGVMQRMKPIVEYAHKPSRHFDDIDTITEGITQTFKRSEMPKVAEGVAKGQGARAKIPIEADELARLYDNLQKVPGSSLQQFPFTHNTTRSPMIPKYHEGFHSLYSGQSAGERLVPKLSPERARVLMDRVLDRTNTTGLERATTRELYANDPLHGLVDALAQYRHGKYGGFNVK